jgi:hypothetical protein
MKLLATVVMCILAALTGFAADVNLAWDASTSPNVAGYKVYHGQASGTYNTPVAIGNQTTYTVPGLVNGTWYFAVTAFDAEGSESGFSNEVSTVIDSSTVPPDPIVSLLKNPGFESGTSDWTFYTSGTGVFSAVSPGADGNGQAASIDISQAGSNTQLFQFGVKLTENSKYKLSVKAKSNTGHGFTISIHQHDSPYTNYGLFEHACVLTSTWSECTAEFTAVGFSGSTEAARFRIDLSTSAAAGDVYGFDDIVLSASVAPVFNKCDLNQDTAVNVIDVQMEINTILGSAQPGIDVNGDGAVNVIDLQLMVNAILAGTGCQ